MAPCSTLTKHSLISTIPYSKLLNFTKISFCLFLPVFLLVPCLHETFLLHLNLKFLFFVAFEKVFFVVNQKFSRFLLLVFFCCDEMFIALRRGEYLNLSENESTKRTFNISNAQLFLPETSFRKMLSKFTNYDKRNFLEKTFFVYINFRFFFFFQIFHVVSNASFSPPGDF